MADIEWYDGTTTSPIIAPVNRTQDDTPLPTPVPLIGIYDGPHSGSSDMVTKVETNFGVTPRLMTQYVVQGENYNLSTGGGQAKLDLYKGIMDRGCGLYITLASKDQHTYSHNDFANELPAAIAVMDQWIEFSSACRAYAATLGLPFYTGWESEFEVKVNAGEITGVTNATFAKSHDLFCERAKSHDPLLQTVYQVGHFDATAIWQVLAAKNVGFDLMGLDPYRGNGSGQTTCQQTVNSKNLTPGNFRSSEHFARLGSPRMGLTETGTHVPGYNDANCTTWINSIPAAMDALDLELVIWFNRNSGPNNDSDLIAVGGRPNAVAALGALIDTENHA